MLEDLSYDKARNIKRLKEALKNKALTENERKELTTELQSWIDIGWQWKG